MFIDDDKIKEISEAIKKPIKQIKNEGPMTIIEFEDGTTIPLYGGGVDLIGLKDPVYNCSFCGFEQNDEIPLVSLNGSEDPLICPKCASRAVELFIENGIEIELDVPNISPYLAEEIEKLTKTEEE